MLTIAKKITGFSVLDKDTPKKPPMPEPVSYSPDRRIVLKPVEGLAERSLRSPKRPDSHTVQDAHGHLHQGHAAWNSDFIRAPAGKFALSISSYTNGQTRPFEIWILGEEAPTSATEICRILSKVLSVDDPEFLKMHLRALRGAIEEPFEFQLPYTGDWAKAGSVGACIAMVLEAYCKAIGYIDDQPLDPGKSPMLAAMTCLSEPKAIEDGGMAFYKDVKNPSEGVEFVVFIKDAMLEPSGNVFPFSVWFAGERLPAESAALCKLMSLALRHSDPFWPAQILNVLLKHTPNRVTDDGGFWGPVPGSSKRAHYRSTLAYVAAIIRHRLIEVGRLDPEGRPNAQRSLFELLEPAPVLPTRHPPQVLGTQCPSCGEMAVQKRDGCDLCLSCDWSKC
jgi:ribonucleoside-diphosphate reductase alpha chain